MLLIDSRIKDEFDVEPIIHCDGQVHQAVHGYIQRYA